MTQGLMEEHAAPAGREDELLRRSFLRFLRAEGIRPTTIQRYDMSIRQFQGFACQMGFPRDVAGEHVAHFLAWRALWAAARLTGDEHLHDEELDHEFPGYAENYGASLRFWTMMAAPSMLTMKPARTTQGNQKAMPNWSW